MFWMAINPAGVGESLVTIGVAGEQDERAARVNLPGWDARFIDEDRAICERLQTNESARIAAGPLLEIERALGDFHGYLAWRLCDEDPPPPVVLAQPGDRPDA